MPSASHSLPQPDRKPEMTCISPKFRTTPQDQAAYTVQAVASLLLIMGSADLDKGNHTLCLDWLGRQLDEAGMILDGGEE